MPPRQLVYFPTPLEYLPEDLDVNVRFITLIRRAHPTTVCHYISLEDERNIKVELKTAMNYMYFFGSTGALQLSWEEAVGPEIAGDVCYTAAMEVPATLREYLYEFQSGNHFTFSFGRGNYLDDLFYWHLAVMMRYEDRGWTQKFCTKRLIKAIDTYRLDKGNCPGGWFQDPVVNQRAQESYISQLEDQPSIPGQLEIVFHDF